jgi:hypothetical protein
MPRQTGGEMLGLFESSEKEKKYKLKDYLEVFRLAIRRPIWFVIYVLKRRAKDRRKKNPIDPVKDMQFYIRELEKMQWHDVHGTKNLDQKIKIIDSTKEKP